MWFASLDGLIAGVLVALAALAPFRRDGLGAAPDVLAVGVVGGLVGALLGFALVAGSTSSGPLQVAAIVGGAVGSALALAVLRGWVVGERRTALAAVAAAGAAAAVRAQREREAARRSAREPSALAELAVAALVVLRGRGSR